MNIRSFANSPATWRGCALFDSSEWNVGVRPDELADIECAIDKIGPTPIEHTDRTDLPLPTFGNHLRLIQHALEQGPGAALLRGLPISKWDELRSIQAFWSIALNLGTPLSQSADGERIFHVRDHGYRPDDPRFRGPASRKRLSFHTDRCDVIAFACLHQAHDGGDTFIVSSVSLYEHLRNHQPDLLAVLCQPFPYLRHTVDSGNPMAFCQLPVFSEQDGHFAAHFLRVLIDRADRSPNAPSLTPSQHKALDVLETLAEDPSFHVRIRLQQGDLLFLNNWTTLHRRSAFTDAPNSSRRHLLRIWLSMPNSRPIAPCFQDHFGNTKAGAIRGGMQPCTG